MLKPSTVAAFVTSMLVTTFLTATSYLGIYLYTVLHQEMRRASKALPVEMQGARAGKRTPAAPEEKLADVA